MKNGICWSKITKVYLAIKTFIGDLTTLLVFYFEEGAFQSY